jgi:serine/threonine protein kinase
MQVLEPSTFIAHYCLLHPIARGGMSHVYLAEDIFTDQLVAIKLVDKDDSEHCERLQREISALAELTHDHILPALDYGPYHSWHYLAMPYIKHGTLRERLAQGPLTPKEAGRILEQVASALQFAHEHGIIHRDIKPSNILLRNGEHVYLTDFGLVKQISEETGITQTGSIPGTPTYMAPELVEHDATTRSDIYALGIVLYQMLTGCIPFKSTTPMGVYWKHLSEQPLPPSTHKSTISPAIDAVVLHALEKNPLHRFGTALEFAQAYQQALVEADNAHLTPDVKNKSSLSAPMIQRGSRKIAAALAVIFFFIIPLGLGFTFYSVCYHSRMSTITPASAPLTVGHTPALLHFPPVPPFHNHMAPPTATDTPQPQAPFSASSHQSPPPHKHWHKHKQKDDHEQEHDGADTEG